MRYQLVGMQGEPSGDFDNVEDFEAACRAAGFTYEGKSSDDSKLPHLRGQPKFKELHGPMGGGEPIRYETWKASEFYSS